MARWWCLFVQCLFVSWKVPQPDDMTLVSNLSGTRVGSPLRLSSSSDIFDFFVNQLFQVELEFPSACANLWTFVSFMPEHYLRTMCGATLYYPGLIKFISFLVGDNTIYSQVTFLGEWDDSWKLWGVFNFQLESPSARASLWAFVSLVHEPYARTFCAATLWGGVLASLP